MMTPDRQLISRVRTVAAAVLATLLLASPALATPSDAWITTKAKLTLLTTEGVSATDVNVDTIDRLVTLHGSVGSAAEKTKAESVVATVDGVASVRNLLQIVPASRELATQRADNEIASEVRAALKKNDSLADSDISVQSVNNGVVLLKGNATTLTDQLSAVQTAGSIHGVRRVATEIRGPQTLADSTIWKVSGSADASAGAKVEKDGVSATAGGAARAVGTAVSDAAVKTANAAGDVANETARAARGAAETVSDSAADLYTTSMVKMRLLADKEAPALGINVDTLDGKVTLFGIVPSADAKTAAEVDARSVGTVRAIKNELQVVPESKQPAVKANDEQVAINVKQSLARRADLKDVSADVRNCVVRLTGRVPSGEVRIEAMQVARATRGVCAVHDDLRFTD